MSDWLDWPEWDHLAARAQKIVIEKLRAVLLLERRVCIGCDVLHEPESCPELGGEGG
jgi:hypothetical protein